MRFRQEKMTFPRRIALLFMFLASRDLLALESEDSIDLFNMTLEELLSIKTTTASKMEETAIEASGTIAVITRNQIRERGYLFLQDALLDLADFFVATASEAVTYNKVTIRGVKGNNKFIILQDGVRISGPSGEDIPIGQNFPLYHVKQIEVVYGPASATYGADALTGVINLITYKNDNLSEHTVNAMLGENNTSYGQWLSSVPLSSEVNLTFGAHFSASNNYDLAAKYPDSYPINNLNTFDGVTVVNAEDRGLPEWPTKSKGLFVAYSDLGGFEFNLNHSDFSFSSATGTLPDTVDYGRQPKIQTVIDAVDFKFRSDINEQLHINAQLSASQYEMQPDSKFTNIFIEYQNGYVYAYSDKIAFDLQAFYQINSNNQLIIGAGLENFSAIPKTVNQTRSYDTDLPTEFQDLFYYGTNDEIPILRYNIKWHNYSLFSQLKTDWSETLNTTLGFRFDESSTYGDTFNPRLALVWQPAPKTWFKLLYGEAFLAPSPRFTYENYGSFAFQRDDGLYESFFMFLPNPELQPEQAKTIEITGSHQFSDALNLTSTIYHQNVDEFIAPVATPAALTDFIPGGFLNFTQYNDNVGKLTANGANISLLYHQSFESFKLESWMNYSYVDGELVLQHKAAVGLPFSASKMFKLGATLRWNKWFISPVLSVIGQANGSEIGAMVGKKSDRFNLVNLYVGYDNIIEAMSLNLRVHNLFDESYYSPHIGSTAFEFVPQDGRYIQLGIQYQF